jgi:hypothetical protein
VELDVLAPRRPRRARHGPSRASVAAACVALALATAAAPGPSAAAPSAAELEAAFVLRLMRFVTWPDGALGDPVRIVVADAPGVRAALAEMVQGQAHGDRPMVVERRLDEGAPPAVAFFGGGSSAQAGLAALGDAPTLTIGDGRGFARAGGMIELVRDGARIQLEVNRGAAARAGLHVSSRVLDLARAVHE